MWNIGERIVCVEHHYNGLVVDKIYTVTKHLEEHNAVWVDGINNTGFVDKQFISVVDFRKLKIERIKERLCGNQVM